MLDVFLVSESTLRSRKRVAAILDRYALRVGSDTWTTAITRQGLEVLHRNLRRVATRQTAVTCFQRTPEGMVPVWTLGRPVQALESGSIPVHRLRLPPPKMPESWRKACLLAHAAGLAHDLGKAGADFQSKLRDSSGKPLADPVRHEWLSVHLLKQIFEKMDARRGQPPEDWGAFWEEIQLQAGKKVAEDSLHPITSTVLGSPSAPTLAPKSSRRRGRGLGLPQAPPVKPQADKVEGGIIDARSALLWLVATHHRLPRIARNNWNPSDDPLKSSAMQMVSLETYFKKGKKPTGGVSFHPQAGAWLAQILGTLWRQIKRLDAFDRGELPKLLGPGESLAQQTSEAEIKEARMAFWNAVAHATRPHLILADHEVSSEDRTSDRKRDRKDAPLLANTLRPDNLPNQDLPWHLSNVGRMAATIVRDAYQFTPGGVDWVIRRKLCQDLPEGHPYYWQTRVGKSLREMDRCPTLVLNMAGTGTGKTRMNARILAELRGEESPLRFSTALNLRSLTLQTIDAYREELGLGGYLAGVIGDRTSQLLHEQQRQAHLSERAGKAPVDPEELDADDDGNPLERDWEVIAPKQSVEGPRWLTQALSRKHHRKMAPVVMAPVAVCTADFLVDAGNLNRQGSHAVARLRVSKSDLVLDEIDSYDTRPLISLLRLVSLAAFYDRNVVASSATLSQECAQALVRAWQYGRWMRCSMEGQDLPGRVVICDHLTQPTVWAQPPREDVNGFVQTYQRHVGEMLGLLRDEPPRRHIEMLPTYARGARGQKWEMTKGAWLEAVREGCLRFHLRHRQEIAGRQTSIGLVRVANIRQAIELASHLQLKASADEETYWQIACYHSNLPVIGRHEIERNLDTILKRKPGKDGGDPLISNPTFLKMLEACPPGKNTIFVVVATPVEEIGRDHDFDWAIIEPSSTQSIVQTAGRVRRHRPPLSREEGRATPNIGLLEFPWRYLGETFSKARVAQWPDESIDLPPLFQRPGLDTDTNRKRHQTFLSSLRRKIPTPAGKEVPFGALSLFLDVGHLQKEGLDAGLKFDLDKEGQPLHLLSRLDNESQKNELSTAERFFSTQHAHRGTWSIHDAYRFYGLRPREPRQVDLEVVLPGDATLSQIHHWGQVEVKVITELQPFSRWLTIRPLSPHSWLGLDRNVNLGRLCTNLGLDPESGLRVKLTQYAPQDDDPSSLDGFFWDLSFGLGRA